jgi:hypothetical protein
VGLTLLYVILFAAVYVLHFGLHCVKTDRQLIVSLSFHVYGVILAAL